MIRNKIDFSAAFAADYLADVGINITPKKIKLLFATYLFALFCYGIHVELRRLETAQLIALPETQYLKASSNDHKTYNILTLGGSNTWGGILQNRNEAYPGVLHESKHHKVTNKAIQSSSSFYPSICIESLMKGDHVEYEIIILEFSLSGFQNFDVLVKRLQYRYPNAIFVYVHLYSLRTATEDSDEGGIKWTMRELTEPGDGLVSYFNDMGGYVYNLPAPENPSEISFLFTPDKKYLSKVGHLKVAEDLSQILDKAQFGTPIPHQFESFDNQWGYGDECQNWFESGANPYKTKGAIMKEISFPDPPEDSIRYQDTHHVLEFDSNKLSSITIQNNLKTKSTVPVFFSYILPANEKLKVQVTISDKIVILEPEMSPKALLKMQEVGVAKDGMNLVKIELLEGTTKFQLAGVAFFGFRHHSGLPMKKMHNTIIFDDTFKF